MHSNMMGTGYEEIHTQFSAEFCFMVASLNGDISEMKSALDQEKIQFMQWDLFLQLVEQHRVDQPVYKILNPLFKTIVPAIVLDRLQQNCRENAVRAVLKTEELLRLVKCMEKAGVSVAALKGQALAFRLYGQIAERPTGDIDLLVYPEALDNAVNVLQQAGYIEVHKEPDVSNIYHRLYIQQAHHMNFWHKQRKVSVELHWKLGHSGLDIPLVKMGELERLTVFNAEIPVLKLEVEFLFLVLHGVGHQWSRLRWLYDIIQIMKLGHNEFDWHYVEALTDSLGIRSIVHQTLFLACYFLNAHVPANFSASFVVDTKGQQMARLAISLMVHTDIKPLSVKCDRSLVYWGREKYYNIQVRSGEERLWYIFQYFTPKMVDLKLITLPKQLWLLYYILRPVYWVWRHAR